MTAILFDVNDAKLRESFLSQVMFDAIAKLAEDSVPSWGHMTPQQMIEHLFWAFQCSTGVVDLPCYTPVSVLDRAKRFLYDNRHTPHEFKNPALGENLPSLQFSTLTEAREALQKEAVHFFEHFRSVPGAIHVHPIFGPLRAEEWERAHFKHCYHHLSQFGTIDMVGTTRT
jgi:oxepin-CoA hydrolase/3-oxo-5,6-dehydrosuberyl-CoA semialdehyde dehydrogenase